MEKGSNAPRSLIFSTRLYQALLAVYPSEFRRAFGGPMLQVFRDNTRRALREAGTAGLLSLWGRTMLDTVQTAIEEHAQRGVEMSKEKFVRISAWVMIIGPVLFLIGGWAKNRPPYIPNAMSSLPIDRYAVPAATPLIVIGLVFMSMGLLGLQLRFSPQIGGAGILLGFGALAGFASAFGAAILAVTDSSPWWELFILGLAGQYLALTIFGFITMRRRLLPRWNGLPLLALWFPVTFFLSMGITPWEITNQALGGLWILSCVMFAGLGYLLQSDSPPAGTTAPAA
jgi:hypothetical protein